MGCQTSKAANTLQQAPATQSPSKTLLESGETEKVLGNTQAESVVCVVQESAAVEHNEVQTPVAPPASDIPPTANSEACAMAMGFKGTVTADSNHGLLRRQRTLCTDHNELDIMVVEFTSHDSTVGSVIGRNCKEMQWKVMYDLQTTPIDIKLHVQEHKLHSNEVSIESNGQPIFQGAGAHAKSKMTEDFRYQWPFRATIKGINEVNFFEFHPPHVSKDIWFPATIKSQRDDGYFMVRAQEPDGNGRIVEMTYPAVHKDDLREAATHQPLAVPEDFLMLEVPKQDPLHASLRVANGELVTRHFGRPSPPLSCMQRRAELHLKVSKDRKMVTANVGHNVLSHFVSGEVQAVKCETERLNHSWTLQVGPFAQHTVQITKRHTLGKIVTLLVDGEVLVEASAADIGCQGKEWQCKFRFVGKRVIDFEVHKSNVDGAPLEETDHVKEQRKYAHECAVVIPNDWDFTTAHFFIDGAPFNELPMRPQPHEEQNLTVDPMALLHSYGITTPYKVDSSAPTNIMVMANQVFAKASDGKKAAGGFFAQCCDCNSVVRDDVKRITK